MRLHVGCAMWTHPAWQQDWQPSSGERLRAYASRCDAVEGNTTFYATPTRKTAESWARQTDESFRFVLKIPKTVTHERRLTGVEKEMRAFLDAIEPLGPRAHALWTQLPPSFSPGDLDALGAFLRRLPRHIRPAVEVRHSAFFADDRAARALEDVLDSVAGEWITFDTTVLFATPANSPAEREARSKKPQLPRRTRALTQNPIVRYHGPDDPDRTVDGWTEWVEVFVAWLHEGRSPTMFLHTPDNASSIELARRFHDEVRAGVPELEPLPEPVSLDPPTLF